MSRRSQYLAGVSVFSRERELGFFRTTAVLLFPPFWTNQEVYKRIHRTFVPKSSFCNSSTCEKGLCHFLCYFRGRGFGPNDDGNKVRCSQSRRPFRTGSVLGIVPGTVCRANFRRRFATNISDDAVGARGATRPTCVASRQNSVTEWGERLRCARSCHFLPTFIDKNINKNYKHAYGVLTGSQSEFENFYIV